MIGIVLNGDKRMEILTNILDGIGGHELSDFADCKRLILPVQGIDGDGYIYRTSIHIKDVIESLYNLEVIYTGSFKNNLLSYTKNTNLTIVNIMDDPEYVYQNSRLTIEGFYKFLLNDLDRSLSDYKIVILGYGNLGKLLAQSFQGFHLTYSVYSPQDIKDLFIFQENIAKNIEDYDIYINTIPANIIKEKYYAELKGKIIYDLASYPYGFPPHELDTKLLGGIPGKVFPYDAANAIAKVIEK